jgi:hypothetical protein
MSSPMGTPGQVGPEPLRLTGIGAESPRPEDHASPEGSALHLLVEDIEMPRTAEVGAESPRPEDHTSPEGSAMHLPPVAGEESGVVEGNLPESASPCSVLIPARSVLSSDS